MSSMNTYSIKGLGKNGVVRIMDRNPVYIGPDKDVGIEFLLGTYFNQIAVVVHEDIGKVDVVLKNNGNSTTASFMIPEKWKDEKTDIQNHVRNGLQEYLREAGFDVELL